VQHEGELVAAQPAHQVVGADQGQQPLGHGLEQGVTRRVPVPVVHRLEAVQVQQDQGPPPTSGPVQAVVTQHVEQAPAVRQPGEGVVRGLVPLPRLGAPQRGGCGDGEHGGRDQGREQQECGRPGAGVRLGRHQQQRGEEDGARPAQVREGDADAEVEGGVRRGPQEEQPEVAAGVALGDVGDADDHLDPGQGGVQQPDGQRRTRPDQGGARAQRQQGHRDDHVVTTVGLVRKDAPHQRHQSAAAEQAAQGPGQGSARGAAAVPRRAQSLHPLVHTLAHRPDYGAA
jgi:hypothetical protein